MSDEEEANEANFTKETLLELRKGSKNRFSRLISTIKSHIDGDGHCGPLKVHRTNLTELYGECRRNHEILMKKAKPAGEALATGEKWLTNLESAYNACILRLDDYLRQYDDDEYETHGGNVDQDTSSKTNGDGGQESVEEIQMRIQNRARKLADDLEDSRVEQARRAEDMKRKAQRETAELEYELNMARAASSRREIQTNSTLNPQGNPFIPMLDPEQSRVLRKRSFANMHSDSLRQQQQTTTTIDSWIYEPFSTVTGAEGQTMITMALVQNLKPFGGDPREWPMFIQSFKSMIHDNFPTDAQRLTMLHTMLDAKLRTGMSQILSSPTAYRQALQELRRKYGHPHLVVRTYIQRLMELSPCRGGDALEDFSTQLHGAVTTLDSAGYGHELNSSVALEGLVRKLPDSLIARWGRQVNRLLPNIPTLRDLDSWLEEEVMSERNVRSIGTKPNNTTPSSGSRQPVTESKRVWFNNPTDLKKSWINIHPTVNAIDGVKFGGECSVCGLQPGHKLEDCRKFMSMPATQRAQTIWDMKNCFRCLGRNHHSNVCKKTDLVCTITGCTGKHNTLLHGAEPVATNRSASRRDD